MEGRRRSCWLAATNQVLSSRPDQDASSHHVCCASTSRPLALLGLGSAKAGRQGMERNKQNRGRPKGEGQESGQYRTRKRRHLGGKRMGEEEEGFLGSPQPRPHCKCFAALYGARSTHLVRQVALGKLLRSGPRGRGHGCLCPHQHQHPPPPTSLSRELR